MKDKTLTRLDLTVKKVKVTCRYTGMDKRSVMFVDNQQVPSNYACTLSEDQIIPPGIRDLLGEIQEDEIVSVLTKGSITNFLLGDMADVQEQLRLKGVKIV